MKFEFNKETNGYEIKEYSQALQECKRFIVEQANLDLIIQNDEDKKVVKKSRTLIRKKTEEIASIRKNLNELVMGKFNEQTKELESELKQADGVLKDKIESYENSLGKPKIITLTIKSYDQDKIDKVKQLALELNMEIK